VRKSGSAFATKEHRKKKREKREKRGEDFIATAD
jgi:hypothetical protein